MLISNCEKKYLLSYVFLKWGICKYLDTVLTMLMFLPYYQKALLLELVCKYFFDLFITNISFLKVKMMHNWKGHPVPTNIWQIF